MTVAVTASLEPLRWSGQQEGALKLVREWLRSPSRAQVFYLAGYAGTGKTTLLKEIAAEARGRVLFAAFTGKAAHVMHKKGCVGASTLHRLIYKAEKGPDGRVRFRLNRQSELATAGLLCVDEISMVGEKLGTDVLSFDRPVLVVGDPAQLPPVKDAGFFTRREPDVMLTEIHRQARDNPIIRLATIVREGGWLPAGRHGDSVVKDRGLSVDDVAGAEQLLVGKNDTRLTSNVKIRRKLGKFMWDDTPGAGDRLVCLRNNYDSGLLNGSMWEVERVGPVVDDDDVPHVHMTVRSLDEERPPLDVRAPLVHFRKAKPPEGAREDREFDHFTFGYALTTHKAQGSQWDDVAIIDESRVFRADADKWLYTAITRAARRVVVGT